MFAAASGLLGLWIPRACRGPLACRIQQGDARSQYDRFVYVVSYEDDGFAQALFERGEFSLQVGAG